MLYLRSKSFVSLMSPEACITDTVLQYFDIKWLFWVDIKQLDPNTRGEVEQANDPWPFGDRSNNCNICQNILSQYCTINTLNAVKSYRILRDQ